MNKAVELPIHRHLVPSEENLILEKKETVFLQVSSTTEFPFLHTMGTDTHLSPPTLHLVTS